MSRKKKPYNDGEGKGTGYRMKTQVCMRPSEKWSAEPETIRRVNELAKMISAGKSRDTIQKYAMEEYQIKDAQARAYYRAALRTLIPDEKHFDEYRRGLIEANLNRLEKIVEKCIDSNDANMLANARQAIAEINRMVMGGNENKVTIAKNSQGEETIEITFEK